MTLQGTLLEPKRFAVHDGPGIRTTFFFKGCVLHCRWCHNPESISPAPQLGSYSHKCISCGQCAAPCPVHAHRVSGGLHHFERHLCTACGACAEVCPGQALKLYGHSMSVEQVVKIALEDEDFYRESGGGVTLSGGEPLMQADFAAAVLRELKSHGLHTAVDTCAHVKEENFRKVIPFTDLFLVDFKHADTCKHQELTGAGNELIKANLQLLSRENAAIEIRIPLVPGCNNDRENLMQTGEFLSTLRITKVQLLPYHHYATAKYAALGMKYMMPEEVEAPENDELQEAAALLAAFGLNAVV